MHSVAPDYAAFLAGKAPVPPAVGFDPAPFTGKLFDFQQVATEFLLRRGRGAAFLDTGLGKTICQLEFAAQAAAKSNGRALILTPLAVAKQIEKEAGRHGYDARVIREATDVREGISICNYDRMDKIDPAAFGAVCLDESSILKSFTGRTTRALIEAFAATPYRLAATATPAPNDHMELGQHAEFLGIMRQQEMLVRWFINDSADTGRWRLKGHAATAFWDWMASWAVMAETPDDLGCDGAAFALPELRIHRHQVAGDTRPPAGALFASDLSATNIHDVKRQTAAARADAVAALFADASEPFVVWCDTDYEADALVKRLPRAVEVRGSMSIDRKEEALEAFATGEALGIITKPSICGMGLNWQHAADMAFVGRSFSYEAWYQAVRRCWRFGQKRPVNCYLAVAEGEEQIGRVIERKAEDHAAMKAAMRAASRRQLGAESGVKVPYNPTHRGRLPAWMSAA